MNCVNYYRPQTKLVRCCSREGGGLACVVAPRGVGVWHAWLLRRGHAWLLPGVGACIDAPGRGACMVATGGGMHGCSRGACVVAPGEHAWLVPGGPAWLLPGGCAWLLPGACAWLLLGACVVAPRGRAWLLRGGGVCVGYDEIRSMSRRYASYWNAFLLV